MTEHEQQKQNFLCGRCDQLIGRYPHSNLLEKHTRTCILRNKAEVIQDIIKSFNLEKLEENGAGWNLQNKIDALLASSIEQAHKEWKAEVVKQVEGIENYHGAGKDFIFKVDVLRLPSLQDTEEETL